MIECRQQLTKWISRHYEVFSSYKFHLQRSTASHMVTHLRKYIDYVSAQCALIPNRINPLRSSTWHERTPLISSCRSMQVFQEYFCFWTNTEETHLPLDYRPFHSCTDSKTSNDSSSCKNVHESDRIGNIGRKPRDLVQYFDRINWILHHLPETLVNNSHLKAIQKETEDLGRMPMFRTFGHEWPSTAPISQTLWKLCEIHKTLSHDDTQPCCTKSITYTDPDVPRSDSASTLDVLYQNAKAGHSSITPTIELPNTPLTQQQLLTALQFHQYVLDLPHFKMSSEYNSRIALPPIDSNDILTLEQYLPRAIDEPPYRWYYPYIHLSIEDYQGFVCFAYIFEEDQCRRSVSSAIARFCPIHRLKYGFDPYDTTRNFIRAPTTTLHAHHHWPKLIGTFHHEMRAHYPPARLQNYGVQPSMGSLNEILLADDDAESPDNPTMAHEDDTQATIPETQFPQETDDPPTTLSNNPP